MEKEKCAAGAISRNGDVIVGESPLTKRNKAEIFFCDEDRKKSFFGVDFFHSIDFFPISHFLTFFHDSSISSILLWDTY